MLEKCCGNTEMLLFREKFRYNKMLGLLGDTGFYSCTHSYNDLYY